MFRPLVQLLRLTPARTATALDCYPAALSPSVKLLFCSSKLTHIRSSSSNTRRSNPVTAAAIAQSAFATAPTGAAGAEASRKQHAYQRASRILKAAANSISTSAAASASGSKLAQRASAAGQMQQQQQYAQLLMSEQKQQQLLESIQDRPPAIFYHYPCPDGVFAALAATLFFTARGVTPRYVPFEVYKETHIQDLQLQSQDAAYLLDYSGPDGFPQQLAQHVSQVVVLDHHKTAAEQLSNVSNHPANLSVCLDMQRSGAAIARDFFGVPGMSDSLQQMYRWVEDADLWRWALPDSKAFHAGLSAFKLDYHAGRNPQIWEQLQQLDVQQVLDKGTVILKYQEQLVAEAVSSSKPYQLGGAQGLTRGWGCCMGCEVSGDLILYRSRLGNSLAEHSKAKGLAPVGMVAYVESDQPNKDTEIKVSLRSIDGFDTSAISGAFGGGGHAAASSCIIKREELKGWQDMAN